MNSVKNAIVTMTLLAVGYGAYVLISNPPPEGGELAEANWEPEVSVPAGNLGGEVSLDAATFPEGSEVPVVETPAADDWASDEPPVFAPTENSVADSAYESDPRESPLDAPQRSNQAQDDATFYAPEEDDLVDTSPYPDDLGETTYGREAYDYDSPSHDASENVATVGATEEPTLDGPSDYPTTSAADLPYESSADSYDDSGFNTSWQSVQTDLRAGQLGNALLSLSAWYGEPTLTAPQRESLQELLDELAGTVIYSAESYIEQPHQVQDGETLTSIARQYGIPAIFLARVNGINQVEPGMDVKVLRGPFRAEVNLEAGSITLFLGRYYAGRFAAQVGPDMPLEDRDFQVAAIQLGREFFDRVTGERVGRDHPDNPYGARWIGLRGDQVTSAHNVGIHVDCGQSGRGCLGVSEQDADDLSAILSIGSRVTIVR